MILTMTHMFDLMGGRYSLLACGDEQWWVMERGWDFNRRNVSCVPRDEYSLVEHDTTKYPGTWAFIGDGVSHWDEPGIPRFACVIHSAVFPSDLQGCFAPAKAIGARGMTIDSRSATDELLALLEAADRPIKVLMQ